MTTDLRDYAKRDSFRKNDKFTELVKESKNQTEALQGINLKEAANDDPAAPDFSEVKEPIKDIDLKLAKSLEYEKSIRDLNVLATSQLDSLVSLTDRMNENVKDLSNRLRDKMLDEPSIPQTVPTATKVVEDLIDKSEPEIERPNTPQIIEPVQEKKSTKLLENKDSKDEDTKETRDKNFFRGAFEGVKKSVTDGFKKSVSIADRLFSMLFKFSIVSMARGAAIAATVFAIIVALDVLKLHWAHWAQVIVETLDGWITKVVGWVETFANWVSSFGDWLNIFQNMDDSLMGIKTAWETGDFPVLALALGKSLLDLNNSLVSAIGRLGTKLVAELLKVLGFKDAGETVEAVGLQYYQNRTGNELDEENQKKLAKYQVEQEKKDGKTQTERGMTSFLPTSFRKMIGALSEDEVSQINAEKRDKSSREGMSDEERITNTAAANEARHSLERYKDMAKAVNPNNPADMAKLEKYKKVAQDNINKPTLTKTPATKADLQATLDSILAGGARTQKPKVSPQPPAEQADVKRVNNIATTQRTKDDAGKIMQPASTNIQTNVSKSNKNILLQRPVTSTRAPGMFGATGVN